MRIQKFRHQISGLEVEAVQFDGENGLELVEWSGGQYCITGKLISGNKEIGHAFVLPLDQIATVGDYIVKGLSADDVFWVESPRKFIHSYDLIVEPLRVVPGYVMFDRPGTPPEDFMLRSHIERARSGLKGLPGSPRPRRNN